MSNCIDIIRGSNVVLFKSDDIDVGKVKEYLKRADLPKVLHVFENVKSEEDRFNDSLWWFFSRRNVSIDDMGVTVIFGEGQSSHTSRDFNWVLNCVIKPIMKRSKTHIFCTRDEYDGYLEETRWKHDFYEGTPPPKPLKSVGKLVIKEIRKGGS